MIKSLSKKEFLSLTEKKILEITIRDMFERKKEIDEATRVRFSKALIDIDVPANIADHQLLTMADSFVHLLS